MSCTEAHQKVGQVPAFKGYSNLEEKAVYSATLRAAQVLAKTKHSKHMCPQLLNFLGAECDEAGEQEEQQTAEASCEASDSEDCVQEQVAQLAGIQVQGEDGQEESWWQEAAGRSPL